LRASPAEASLGAIDQSDVRTAAKQASDCEHNAALTFRRVVRDIYLSISTVLCRQLHFVQNRYVETWLDLKHRWKASAWAS